MKEANLRSYEASYSLNDEKRGLVSSDRTLSGPNGRLTHGVRGRGHALQAFFEEDVSRGDGVLIEYDPGGANEG
jgi:hypothetical protein